MELLANTRIDFSSHEAARRTAPVAVPVRLWRTLSTRWHMAVERRVEYCVHLTEHDGVVADFQTARQYR
jgi:hypothetical protein